MNYLNINPTNSEKLDIENSICLDSEISVFGILAIIQVVGNCKFDY